MANIPDLLKHLPVPHDDGHFISERISRIVDLVRTYGDGSLDVKWIPVELRDDPTDPAFAIVENLKSGQQVIAFHVQDESEFDERVLERIYRGDNTKHNVMSDLEAKNLAAATLRTAEQMDRLGENHDIAHHVLASSKSSYTVKDDKGRVISYDERGATPVGGKKFIR